MSINVMLSAAAFNFKKMMNKWKSSFMPFFQRLFWILQYILLYTNQINYF